MINETTEGQEAGEQREELFFKVIKAGNKILEILAALLYYSYASLWCIFIMGYLPDQPTCVYQRRINEI